MERVLVDTQLARPCFIDIAISVDEDTARMLCETSDVGLGLYMGLASMLIPPYLSPSISFSKIVQIEL
jgi:hypothetical protein